MLCRDTTSSIVNVEQQLEGEGAYGKIRSMLWSGWWSQFGEILLVELSCSEQDCLSKSKTAGTAKLVKLVMKEEKQVVFFFRKTYLNQYNLLISDRVFCAATNYLGGGGAKIMKVCVILNDRSFLLNRHFAN